MNRLNRALCCLFLLGWMGAGCQASQDGAESREPHATPAAIRACTAAMLQSRAETEGASGFILTYITYTNTSSDACTLYKQPRLMLVDVHRKALAVAYTYERTETNAAVPLTEPPFTVQSNQSVQLALTWEARCPPETTAGIVVQLRLADPGGAEETPIANGERACDAMFKTAGPVQSAVRIRGFLP